MAHKIPIGELVDQVISKVRGCEESCEEAPTAVGMLRMELRHVREDLEYLAERLAAPPVVPRRDDRHVADAKRVELQLQRAAFWDQQFDHAVQVFRLTGGPDDAVEHANQMLAERDKALGSPEASDP